MEGEIHNRLSFLDCTVVRKNNCFETSVYRKATFTGLGLSYFSFCSYNFKLNSIRTLLSRAFRNASTYAHLHSELNFLKSFFQSNGYPSSLVLSNIKKFLSNKFSTVQKFPTVSKNIYYLSLPYFGSQSDKMKFELSNLLNFFSIWISK